MNDISGQQVLAGEAVTLGGVNLSLGRGAARVHILRDIDLHIGRGEAVALLGPSGSGKSTLLMVMTGLERPDGGLVVVAGQDLVALDEDRLARFRGKNIGIVFQAFHLIPTMTAIENVAVPLELAGIRDAQAKAERELIELLFRGHSQRGTTLVLVTHDAALAARCNRVLHMRSGRIEEPARAANRNGVSDIA
jgi:putative ABC transport system ATP-binding protein